MLFDDTYLTIEARSEGLVKDRGSKFMSYAYPVESEEEIKNILQQLRKDHTGARHFCYAYRLGADKLRYRINDDGEPSGSAGKPIYNQLLSRDLTNILVVVVRYFGGTLLGVPGLINAYKNATIEALDQAKPVTRIVSDCYSVEFDYLRMNEVMKIIKDHQLELKEQHMELNCIFHILIRKKEVAAVIALFEKLREIKISYLYTI